MDMLVGNGVDESEREADGFVRGLVVAQVTDNQDPDGLARVRVRLPWQAEGDSSFWARIAVPMTGDRKGTYFLPDVDDEVLVAAERGDPSHLYVLGMLWNGQKLPPETNDDGQNNKRVILSRAESFLAFFDGDPPSVELALKDGKHLLMDDQGVVLEDGKGNTIKIESASGAITIESSGQLKLKAQTVSIESGASMEIKASGTLTLQGALVQIN